MNRSIAGLGGHPPSHMSTSTLALTRERRGATLAWEGSMSSVQAGAGVTEPGRQGLWLGILAYRWASYVWMTILAIIAQANEDFARPGLAWTAIAITGLWTLWFSVTRGWERAPVRRIDLALAVALVMVSGYVMEEGGVIHGIPFFATSYPASAAMTMGAARGVGAGLEPVGGDRERRLLLPRVGRRRRPDRPGPHAIGLGAPTCRRGRGPGT
jgi:hypothetical protein